MRTLILISFSAIVVFGLKPSLVFAQERVDSSYHLAGDAVQRRPPTPVFVDRDYFLLRGEKTGRGCRYLSLPFGAYNAQRIVESDESHCLQIRSEGVFLGPPTLPSGAHTIMSTFSARFDSARARFDTATRDTVPRKP